MAVVSFQLSANADRGKQEHLLDQVRSFSGVSSVGRIDAESNDDDILRMCIAKVADGSRLPSVLDALHRVSGIEGVSVESRRGLE
jgi:hypothetical protein